ncbi:oxidoreductase [Candidatus Woesebacteria bacterium]|nr:oxidoreductase [Candidatus Woesebacteria bacterium]
MKTGLQLKHLIFLNMRIIDDFLNNITMYRLILYYLLVLAIVALIYSIFGVLPFNFLNLIFSFLFITSVSWLCNVTFAEIFKVPTNLESVYITSLILFLIISPARHTHDLFFLGWIAVISEASKYIFALKKKHIFNPAAFAVLLTYFVLNQSASWWIGTASMFPFVLIGGLLLTRKIKRFDLVLSFLMVASLTIIFFTLGKRTDLATILKKTYLDSPILFFAFVMLTEPLTTPGTFDLRVLYGAITGFLFAPQLKLGLLTTTPEIALVLGNIFSYLVGSKEKLILTLSQKIKINPDSYDFVFNLVDPPKFNPGQYMEWTLGHQSPDSRGNRRYFTISSSPTEKNIRIAVKFHENGGSFKRRMLEMNVGDKIVASQITGDFTLPKDTGKKLVFVAGGIGITPFRSIIKCCI